MKRAIFFDRDGVLGEVVVRDGTPHPPASVRELRLTQGAREAVDALRGAGFEAIVVTNQPDVARGTARRPDVEAITQAIAGALGIDAAYTCFHDDADACNCRKPQPGLVLRAGRERGLDLRASYFIGDRVKDVACGRAAGCTTVFLDRRYAETPADTGADFVVGSIGEAARRILELEAALQ